jgi:hypothetical protein
VELAVEELEALLLELVELLELLLEGVLKRLRAVAREPDPDPVAPLVPLLPDVDAELLVADVPEELAVEEELDELLPPPGPRRLPRIWGASREVNRSGEVLPASRRVRSNRPEVTWTVRTDTSGALPGCLLGASDRTCQSRPDPATKAASRSVDSARLRFFSDCIADLPGSIHTNPEIFQRE